MNKHLRALMIGVGCALLLTNLVSCSTPSTRHSLISTKYLRCTITDAECVSVPKAGAEDACRIVFKLTLLNQDPKMIRVGRWSLLGAFYEATYTDWEGKCWKIHSPSEGVISDPVPGPPPLLETVAEIRPGGTNSLTVEVPAKGRHFSLINSKVIAPERQAVLPRRLFMSFFGTVEVLRGDRQEEGHVLLWVRSSFNVTVDARTREREQRGWAP